MKNYRLCLIIGCLSLATTALHSQSSCFAPPANLISWWRAENNALDSVGTNNGTLVSGPGFTNGLVGKGFVFTGGGDDYVALPQNIFPLPAEGAGSAPFSFEIWFKTSASGVILGQQDITPFDVATGYVPALYVGTNGLLYASMFYDADYATTTQLISPTPVNNGAFHHAAVTYDGTTEVLYLDGVAVHSVPFTQQGYTANYHYQLGTGYTAGWAGTTGLWSPFKGVVDEASLYGRALTPGEIVAIFNAGSAGKCFGTITVGVDLKHRYSFGESAGTRIVTDLVGGANGSLLYASTNAPYTNGTADGSAFNGAGQLSVHGTGYIDLPDGLVSSLSNVTFEAWVTWTTSSPGGWQRIFDFGSSDRGSNAPGTGTNFLVLTVARGDTNVPGFVESTVNPAGTQVDPNALNLNGTAPLALGVENYVAVTYNPAAQSSQLFVNGVLVNSVSGRPLNPLNKFADFNNWLGRSQYLTDPLFIGQFDEFRIWEGILSASQIADHFSAGPNQQFQAPPRPVLAIARAGVNVVLSWPTNNTTGFQLQSAVNLNAASWLAVTNPVSVVNTSYRVTFPATGTATFFRLKL